MVVASMNFIIASTFIDSLARLATQAQTLVKQAAFDLQLGPEHPSFQLHRLDRATDKHFWSARVNLDLRIILYRDADHLVLCYAAPHDEAYRWGQKRRFEVHPQTHAAQVVEIHERVEEVVKYIPRETPLLFGHYDSDYLLALGVPEAWLDAVRHAGEEHLDELLDRLPQEAAERLLKLACGEPVPRPVTVTETPFAHPDAQRRFRVIDNQQELRRALEYPWERWIVFLHPTQRGVVERRYGGPARVSGAAGTGKSVVALHRAAALARSAPQGRVLLTTFSKTLAARLSQNADLLLGSDAPERAQIDIVHLHKLARDTWVNTLKRKFAFINTKRFNELLQTAIAKTGVAECSPAFLKAEWEAIVNFWGINDEETYLRVSRKGRGTRLGIRQRRAVWGVFTEFLAVLEEKHYMTWERLCFRLAAELAELAERPPPYLYVVADEAQDFGPAEFRLLRALVAPGDNDLFLCGDAGQRIYQPRFSWKAAGIEVRGRATRLTVNYRTTEQIRRFADTLLPAALDEDGDSKPEPRASISLLKGPPPEVSGYAHVNEEIAGVAQRLRELTAGGFSPRDIAIFCRSETRLKERAEPALQQCGLAGHYLSDEAPPTDAHVSLGSMHRAKGLEFKIVIVMGCDEDMLPRASVLSELVDEADRAVFIEQERQLLYVACTRARERLLVTYSGRPSCFLQT
ncbi:MAG: AAA family ATPase [Candidatus Competibacteraceae bacterium]|nr:MAG: AAA family ATPase [Candidatus Competibacteraceae bacterium]